MKTYSIAEIKKIASEQGYKLCALEDSNGKRLQPYNTYKVDVKKQLDIITTRLKSELFADGIYYCCLSQTINKSKNPDKYPIAKGVVKLNESQQNIQTPVYIQNPVENVLSWESALKFQSEIAELKSRVRELELENNMLSAQLEEAENEIPLSDEGKENSTLTFLKETLPSVVPMLDRYFDLEEKKLNLIGLKNKVEPKPQHSRTTERKEIIVGSQDHLNIIEFYFNKDKHQELDRELDKLQEYDENLYIQVCNKLGIELEEGGAGE